MSKLSAYTEATAGNAADFIYVVQGGATKKVTIGNLAGPFSKQLAFSAGITLGADTDVLDRHKISTWTPTVQGTVTAGGPHTYAAQAGFYVRIGDLVWLSCFVQTSSLGSAMSGNVQVAGLPFASIPTTNLTARLSIDPYLITFPANYTYLIGKIAANSSVILIGCAGSNQSSGSIPVANWAATAGIYMSGIYQAA